MFDDFVIEREIPSATLSAPRKAWMHRSTTGEAKDCLLFLDGKLFTERVKAPAILREAEGVLPSVTGAIPRVIEFCYSTPAAKTEELGHGNQSFVDEVSH